MRGDEYDRDEDFPEPDNLDLLQVDHDDSLNSEILPEDLRPLPEDDE